MSQNILAVLVYGNLCRQNGHTTDIYNINSVTNPSYKNFDCRLCTINSMTILQRR